MTETHERGREAGLVAQFARAEQLVEAAKAAREKGYRRFDAFSPFPLEALPDAMGLHGKGLAASVLAGGIIGGAGGFFMLTWSAVVSYPYNIGGRPFFSWPAFIPVTFELTILGAALAAFLGLWAFCGLPRPYHPLFNVPEFARASNDRFFLWIESEDPRYDVGATRTFLRSLGAEGVYDVPR